MPIELDYLYAASPEESLFYTSLSEGKLVGQRCPTCGKVYIPPRSACPADGTPTAEEIELPDTGTVTTFCIVNVPFLGQRITPPYVSAYILLDGADIAFLHLILDIPAEEVRMGMRVKAVWKPKDEWGTTIENIDHFAPTGEPDADYETYRHHLEGATCERRRSRRLRAAADGRVRRVPDLRRAAGAAVRGVLRADRLDPARTSGSGARGPRTTWPAGRSRSSRPSTRSA